MKTNSLIILLITIVVTFTSCLNTETKRETISTSEEKSIINKMDCWESYQASTSMALVFEKDEDKKKDISDNLLKLGEEAKEMGAQSLYNDTLFIFSIRNDSIYKSKLKERKLLSKSLYSLRNCLPLFKNELLLICKGVVNYNCLDSCFGIIREGYNKDDLSLFSKDKFYSSTTNLFKEAYKKDTNSKITDEQIVKIKDLLVAIENIDKHIWSVPSFFQTKNKIEAEALKKKQEQNKLNKFDTLSKK